MTELGVLSVTFTAGGLLLGVDDFLKYFCLMISITTTMTMTATIPPTTAPAIIPLELELPPVL